MAFQRETAYRMFADEFNASRKTIEGEGEKDPSYVVTPTGAKANRVHVVGVCTEVEPMGESGDFYRARISDPTGVYTVSAGQYQPEAAQALTELQPPCFVAVTGKARAYEPEPGTVFMSIRAEHVSVVDEPTRNQWILDTARRSTDRLKAVDLARNDATIESMLAAGVSAVAAEGVMIAKDSYVLDSARYWQGVRKALEGILPGGSVPVHEVTTDKAEPVAEAPAWTPPAETKQEDDPFDDDVLALVGDLEGDGGARWDDILERALAASETPRTNEDVEEALNRLMDKGLVYEPTLGVLKTT